MLYQIDSNYYVKVGNKFAKVSISLDNKGELVLTPTNEKIENNGSLQVRPVNLATEKESIINSLKVEKRSLFTEEKSFRKNKFTSQR